MNKVFISGRLATDVSFYPAKSEGSVPVARYRVALDHRKDAETTFLSICTFGRGAEFARDNLIKGKRYMFTCHIQGTKDAEGKPNGVEFIAEEVEFVEPKSAGKVDAE